MAAKRSRPKLDLLKRYGSLGPTNQRNAALNLKISQPLLCKLLKSTEELRAQSEENTSFSCKRSRGGKSTDVEEAFLLWFTHTRERDAPISQDTLFIKAHQLSSDLGVLVRPMDG